MASKSIRRYELRRPVKDAEGNPVRDADTGKTVSEGTGKYVWRARYRDANGKDHTKHEELKRDAQRWLDERTADIITGKYVDPAAGKLTWTRWVELWRSQQTWTDTTHDAVVTACKSVPWGDRQLKAVKHADVKAWVAAETKRGLKPSTIKTRLNYVNMAFIAAVSQQRIAENPARNVKAPRQRRAEASMQLLSAEQLTAVLTHAGNFLPFIAVCLFAGLRLGEAAGLRVCDVDAMARTIRVEQQAQGSTLKAAKLVPPKYGQERTIYVSDELLKILSAHIVERRVSGEDLVLGDQLGRMYNRSTAGEEWRRLRQASGLPDDLTLHNLRHTYASNLIAAGCDVVTVQRALGHATPSITLNTYAHLWPSAEDRTRAASGDFARGILESVDSAWTSGEKPQVRELPHR